MKKVTLSASSYIPSFNMISYTHSPTTFQAISGKLISFVCLVALSVPLTHAQTWTPTAAGPYNWDDNANWSASPFPNAVDADADFSVDFAGDQTVSLSQIITVGRVTFEDTGASSDSALTVVSGTGGSLVLQTSSGSALLTTKSDPVVTISADMVVNSDTTVDTTNSGSSVKGITLSGNLSGSGTIRKDGSKGRLMVTGDNSSFTGNWILDGAVSTSYFRINADNNLGAVPVTSINNITVNNNNTMEFGTGTYTINANRDILVNGGVLLLRAASYATKVTLAGDISGVGGVTRSDSGSYSGAYVRLSGNNTYTGKTTVTKGILEAGSTSAFGSDSEVVMGTNSYAKLDLNDFDNSIGSLSGGAASGGSVILGSATLTTGSNDMSTTYGGVISGTGGLTKVGTGTMTLSEVNTYTGATTILGGILEIGASDRIDDSSALILGGGTFDTGGFSETLDTLTLNSNSILDFGAGASALAFADSSAISWTGTLTLANFDIGTDTLRFGTSDSSLTEGQLSSISWTGGAASLDTDGYLVAIPEPSTFMLVGVFMFALVGSARARKSN
ncbi:autotransporter-associated beta strand repeat-containing protein [Kiritimatiellaeota bacterium B1221]|nr:autotransporter-associated beta strand repeat-containing protein [Kiritimatiellaeota bacterium B1221]